jgi:outer membrane protein TolC
MKKVMIVPFLLICAIVNAQKVDYNTIILPMNASDIEFPEKLVRLAWQNNPSVGVLNSELEKSDLGVKYARWNWLDNFRVTGNLNEFTINKPISSTDGSLFFPRYNISASISLGNLFTTPMKTKMEKENVTISTDMLNQKKLEIRSEVLRKYQTYISNKEIYDLRNQMMEDSFSDYKLKEQNFTNGEIQLTEYTLSLDRYNQQKINKIQAEKELNISRIEVEELIGVKLADVR